MKKHMSGVLVVISLGCASAFQAVYSVTRSATHALRPPMMVVGEPLPPEGFTWGLDTSQMEESVVPTGAVVTPTSSAVAPTSSVEAPTKSVVAPTERGSTKLVMTDTDEPKKREAYFCNDEGCWIAEQVFCDETGCWLEAPDPDTPVTLPDGRSFSFATGVEAHAAMDKRRKVPMGIFAPAVIGAKQVLGTKELNTLRGDVIGVHSKVIAAFVDTSESPFGQIVLKRMFEAADKDGNGSLDKEEVREALHALGFKFVKEKQIGQIFSRADLDGNEVIDFEEFVQEAPKTLRTSLVKLAKQNGHDLGFLA